MQTQTPQQQPTNLVDYTAVLDNKTLEQIKNTATLLPEAALIIIEGHDPNLNQWVAKHLANNTPEMSYSYHQPADTRWKVEELNTILENTTRYRTTQHQIVVVANPERTEPRTLDRFLKQLEQPVTPATYIFTTPNRDLLPPALQSRSGNTITVTTRNAHNWLKNQWGTSNPTLDSQQLHTVTQFWGSLVFVYNEPTNIAELARLTTELVNLFPTNTPATHTEETVVLFNQLATLTNLPTIEIALAWFKHIENKAVLSFRETSNPAVHLWATNTLKTVDASRVGMSRYLPIATVVLDTYIKTAQNPE